MLSYIILQTKINSPVLQSTAEPQLHIFIVHLIADFHKNVWLNPEVSCTWTSTHFLLKQALQLLRINSTCSGHCFLNLSFFSLSCSFILTACNLFEQKDRCEAAYYFLSGSLDRQNGRNYMECLCVWVLTYPDSENIAVCNCSQSLKR